MISMKFAMAFVVMNAAATFGGGYAVAATCSGSGNANSPLSGNAITSLLSGRYACIGSSPNAQWNELHNGTQVLDYKKGPTDPVDPSDTAAHPTGTYAVSGGNSTGTVTYTYGSAGPYGYTIRANQTGKNPWSGTGTYSFCSTTGGQNLDVTVSASHC